MAGMEQGLAAPRARLTAQAKAARRKRIFERLREGWSYDEIARQERLTARRVRQIVAEVLRKPKVDGAARVRLALEGLGPTLRAACEAVLQGDVRMIAALTNLLDRLWRRLQADKTWGTRAPQTPAAGGGDAGNPAKVAATP